MDKEIIFNNLIQKTVKDSEASINALVDRIREIICISDTQNYPYIDGVNIDIAEEEITGFRMDYIDINGSYQQSYFIDAVTLIAYLENQKFKKLVDQLIEVKEGHTWFNFNPDLPEYTEYNQTISLYDKGLYVDIRIDGCYQYNFILNVDVIEKIMMSAKAGSIREAVIKEVKAMLDITTKLSDGAKLLIEMN